jgi:hypothetical protein
MIMKRGKVLLLLLAAGLLVLTACSPKDIQPFEGRLSFQVKESYRQMAEGVEPSICLSMETEKIYECCNYSIVADFLRTNALLMLDIKGIERPAICLTALGPAVGGRFLELGEGVYSLEFRCGSARRSVYELAVNGEAITIAESSGAGGTFTVPQSTLWWRYPRNSFAVICGTTVETAWVFEDFLGRLQAGVDLVLHEFPPDGEIGYPRAPQGYYVNHPSRFFLYGEAVDFEEAGEILREYVRDVIGGMTGVNIWLLNWKNESFRSSMMGSGPE